MGFKKEFLIFFAFIFFYIFLLSFFWQNIQLPIHNENNSIGFLTLNNINPLNDTLRFVLFVAPPIVACFLFFKLNFSNKIINIRDLFKPEIPKKLNYSLKDILLFKLFFFLFVIFEFLTLDFLQYKKGIIDTLHDGDYLTPLINYINYKGFWSSSFTIHGGRDLFIPIASYNLFGNSNYALIKFFYISLILPIKLLSIFLAYQISRIGNFDKNYRIIIFIISCPFLLSLSSYDQVYYFSIRDLFVLIFFIIFIQIFLKKSNLILIFLLSLVSVTSLLFHYDTGIYLNFILFFFSLYLLLSREFKTFFILYFSFSINFLFFYFFFGGIEIINFFDQIKHIIQNIDKIHGLEFPQPFFSIGDSADGARATKLLVFFLCTGISLNFIVLFKNNFLSKNEKVLIIFVFLYSLISFKNALGRSDGPHMMVSSDWITIFIFYLSLFTITYYLFSRLKKKINIRYVSIIFILLMCTQLIFKYDNNILNFKKNILSFVNAPNSSFVTQKRKEIIKKISNLTNKDECIQNFTQDLSLPYLIGKPTCSKFFSSWIISGKENERKYIKYLKLNKASHIIYKSPYFNLDGVSTQTRLKLVDDYIQQNYIEVFNQQNYVILKRNTNKN